MQSKYIGIGCPDNPARVADYGALPGEALVEPEIISALEAYRNVMAAIARNDEAYGLSADAWAEEIANVHYPELRDMVLATCQGAYPEPQMRHLRRVMALCERIANEHQGDI